jgi:riboflavin kinase/FMN adenylyltransferase
MRVIRHCGELAPEHKGCVVALGNFDGVHLGHQAVMAAARDLARDMAAPWAVMSFEPHPRAFFNPSQKPFRLTPFRVKARLIEALGADFLFSQHFDAAFAATDARHFVETILVAGMGAKHVVIGYDYVFGKGRQGTGVFLNRLGDELGFGVTVVPPAVAPTGEVYSSTKVREYLVGAKPAEAAQLLGHYWEIEGRVEHGDARGRTIGFPTANLHLGEYQHPATGVYAVRAGIDQGGATIWHDGVANFGRRPTFDKTEEVLEVHLLDFAGDLYGKHLRVALIDFVRRETRFDSVDELKAQISEDAAIARLLLNARHLDHDPGPWVPVSKPTYT